MAIQEFKPMRRKQGVIDVHGFGEQSLAPFYPKMTMSLKEPIPLSLHNRIETIIEMIDVDGISSLSVLDEDALFNFIDKHLLIKGDLPDVKEITRNKVSELTAKSKELRELTVKLENEKKELEKLTGTEELGNKEIERISEIDKTLKLNYNELDTIATSIKEVNQLAKDMPDPNEMSLALQIDMIKVFFILVRKQAQKK